MRSFSDLDHLVGRVPGRLVAALSAVDVGRGSEALHRDQLPGLLSRLADRARVASITASSAIEGVVVDSPARADLILAGKARTLRTRGERKRPGRPGADQCSAHGRWVHGVPVRQPRTGDR